MIQTSEIRRIPVFMERLLLIALSPVVFLVLTEIAIAVSGIETDLARNEDAEIAVPVWLLADDVWVSERRMQRSEGDPIAANEVEWLRHFEEARFIQYKMRPDVDVLAVNPFNETEIEKEVTFHLASNSDGFRDREFGPKPPGTTRIVTIGDSSTFGWGSEPEHTYQHLLEKVLNDGGGGPFEILNLGIPGHTTRHGLGLIEHYALPLDPDVLIVNYGSNDPRPVPSRSTRYSRATRHGSAACDSRCCVCEPIASRVACSCRRWIPCRRIPRRMSGSGRP